MVPMTTGAAIGAAALLGLLATGVFVQLAHRLGWGKVIRGDGPESHRPKHGTPTMGGAAFVLVALATAWAIGPRDGPLLPSYRPTVPPSHRPTVSPSHRLTVPPSHRPTVAPSHRPTVPPPHRRTALPTFDFRPPTSATPSFYAPNTLPSSYAATGQSWGNEGVCLKEQLE